ncbi:MAG: hypothetical protein ABIN13_11680 [Mucilaginibacter sp.]
MNKSVKSALAKLRNALLWNEGRKGVHAGVTGNSLPGKIITHHNPQTIASNRESIVNSIWQVS